MAWRNRGDSPPCFTDGVRGISTELPKLELLALGDAFPLPLAADGSGLFMTPIINKGDPVFPLLLVKLSVGLLRLLFLTIVTFELVEAQNEDDG